MNYLALVEHTLVEKWPQAEGSQVFTDADNKPLELAISLFASLAFQKASQSIREIEKLQPGLKSVASLQYSSKELTEMKITEYVSQHACVFRKVCQVGFPFALLSFADARAVIQKTLENGAISLIANCFSLPNIAVTEEGLDELLPLRWKELALDAIQEAGLTLMDDYLTNKNNKAGFHLLWLIKKVSNAPFEIPKITLFNDRTVGDVLAKFLTENHELVYWKQTDGSIRLFDFLYSRFTRCNPFLHEKLLDHTCQSLLFTLTYDLLREVSFDQAPNKGKLIIDLFEVCSDMHKRDFAKNLAQSHDPLTAAIGIHVFKALEAPTYNEALPHFYALKDVLPFLNETHFERIFFSPFPNLFYESTLHSHQKDFSQQLKFSNEQNTFVFGTIMVGVYDSGVSYGNKRILPYLMACDLDTKKIIWGMPLSPAAFNPSINDSTVRPLLVSQENDLAATYSLARAEQMITLQFTDSENLHIIFPLVGHFITCSRLPQITSNLVEDAYFTPDGITYHVKDDGDDRLLVGGSIINHEWNKVFIHKTPIGLFQPLSTHCGFKHPWDNWLILFSPQGAQRKIERCVDAQARGPELYTLENNETGHESLFLKIQDLLPGDEVLSDVKFSLKVRMQKGSIAKICDNGMVIILSKNTSGILSPIFVSRKTHDIVYSTHHFPSYGKYIINSSTAEIWTWDELSKKLWKISSESITEIGMLEKFSGNFLHVDEKGSLFYN